MKGLVVAGALVLAVVGAIVFLWPSARTGAEPIAYGVDACAQCRMHLARPGFAGELRDHAGVLTKYDDLGCLLRAMAARHREVPELWVEDHASAEMVPLLGATLVQSDGIETPMGSGIVAFEDERVARAFARDHDAAVISLESLLSDPERLDPNRRHAAREGQR